MDADRGGPASRASRIDGSNRFASTSNRIGVSFRAYGPALTTKARGPSGFASRAGIDVVRMPIAARAMGQFQGRIMGVVPITSDQER